MLAELLELAPGGVEEVGLVADPEAPWTNPSKLGSLVAFGSWEEAFGRYEFAIYGSPRGVPALPEPERRPAGASS